jgi:hypothetical protein
MREKTLKKRHKALINALKRHDFGGVFHPESPLTRKKISR